MSGHNDAQHARNQMAMLSGETAFQNSLDNDEEYKCDSCGVIDHDEDFAEFRPHRHMSIFLCEDCAETRRFENYPTHEVR